MATADEILATMAEEAAATDQTAEVCTIDRCTRAVTIPEALRIVGVETDKDVTRRHFKVLCSYRGTNLSTFRIRIHFMNANKEKDIYYVTDAAQDGEYLTFSWVISRNATKYKGKLKFIACMVCDGGTDEEREWNSTLGEFTVLEGLEVELTDGEEEQARDAITQLLAVIDARESEAVEAVSAQGATQVAAVRAAGAQQEASIAAKGAATLETIPDDYATLHNNVATLTQEIETLNQGGLNLKEDFIGEQVNEWLDEHPEATTTVQDHSLTVNKLVVGTLGYVTPEMFGAVGDGVTDDTEAIQKAINTGKRVVLDKSYIVTSTLISPSSLNLAGNGVVRYRGDAYLFESQKDYNKIEGLQIIGNNENGLFSGVGYNFRMIGSRISNFRNVLNFEDVERTYAPYLYFEGVKIVEVQTFIESVDSINNCVLINCTFNCVVAVFKCYSCLYEDLTLTGCVIEKVKNLIYYNSVNRLQSVNLFGGYYEDCTLLDDSGNCRYHGTLNMIGGWLYDTNHNTDFVDGKWVTTAGVPSRKLLNITNGGDNYCLKINIAGIEVTKNTDAFMIAQIDQSVIGFIRCTLANSRVANDLRSLITFTSKERVDTIVNTVTGEQHALPIKSNIIPKSEPEIGEIGVSANLPSFNNSGDICLLAPLLYGDNIDVTKQTGANFYTCFAITTDDNNIRFKNPNGYWYKIALEYDSAMNTSE